MRSARRIFLALLMALLALLLFLAGCGDSPSETAERRTSAELPFPPTAFEPATSRGGGPAPEGRVVRVGGRPEGVAIDSATGVLGVALGADAGRFALLDAATLKVRATVPLPAGARHVSFGAGRFLVPMEDADMLAQVPPSGGEPTLVKVGDGPHDATAADSQLFVGDEFGGTVTVLRGGRVRATLPVDVQPGGIVDVGGGKVAIVSVRAYTVELLDTQTLRTSGSQNAGYGPSHAVATADGRVLVADTRGGAVLVYETRPRLKFIQRLETGGSPYGLAVDRRRERLWVTDSGADRVLAIDTRGELKELREYPTVQQPNSVAVDERTGAAVVVGQAAGELQRIAP